MKLNALTSLAQVADFLAGTQPVTFSVLSTKEESYQWIQGTLLRFEYLTLSKPDKGLVCRYLEKVSGYLASISRGSFTSITRADV